MNIFASIQLDKNRGEPLYQQLANAIYKLIQENILKPDDKLPPIRTLAKQLNVNNVTVVNAYKHLENRGIVYSQVGSGTYVSPIPIEEINTNVLSKTAPQPKKSIILTKDTLNFASISPSTDLFPVEDFKTFFNNVLDRDGGNAFNYQDSQGYKPLRESICNYLTSYNIHTSPDRIQIISGAQQGIDILSKVLLEYGDLLFVEKPTYHGAIAAFQSRGAKIMEIPLEEDGININLLEDYMKQYQPRFLYIMSYFQNPTGITYSAEKKRTLINLAEKYDTYIIEDDYLGDLNYSEEPYIPLKSFDHNNRVIYIKTFSKILMPGLRLGFIVLPTNILQNVLAAKHTTDIATSGLIQRTFDLYLRSNLWKEHIKIMRTFYQQRYEVMVRELEPLSPKYISFSPPQGGLSIWIKIENNIDIENLCDELLEQKIIVSPASLFALNPKKYPYIRMSFADVEKEKIPQGIKTLKSILDKYSLNSNDTISVTPFL